MPYPYFMMSLLYLSLVALGAFASLLTGLGIIPDVWKPGMVEGAFGDSRRAI